MDSKTKVERITEFLSEKKARDINVIKIRKVSIIADYFIICSGGSTTHIKALADDLEKRMQEYGLHLAHNHKEGYESARWILLDYSDVVVHIFHENDRKFYNLERLWTDGILTEKQRNTSETHG